MDNAGIGQTGEMVIIHNVTRYCDDFYECVATNGVPPTVTRQMRVTVECMLSLILYIGRIDDTASVCHGAGCANTAERIDVLFEVETPGNLRLNGGLDFPH